MINLIFSLISALVKFLSSLVIGVTEMTATDLHASLHRPTLSKPLFLQICCECHYFRHHLTLVYGKMSFTHKIFLQLLGNSNSFVGWGQILRNFSYIYNHLHTECIPRTWSGLFADSVMIVDRSLIWHWVILLIVAMPGGCFGDFLFSILSYHFPSL